MQREYHRWYSERLGAEMGCVVYGHWGLPLLGFPTSAGDEFELENQGLVGSLADFIDAGRMKFFAINSVNSAGFYNKGRIRFIAVLCRRNSILMCGTKWCRLFTIRASRITF